MSGPGFYAWVPWRTDTLSVAERVENIARARQLIAKSTDPEVDKEALPDPSWAYVCLEYEDLLRTLGHGLPGEDVHPLADGAA